MVRLIKEFANSRKDEIQKLKNIREILREHLMCIYYWRDSNCLKHWEGEIVGFLPIMNKLKNTHKLLPEKLIYENLFEDWADRFNYDIYTYIDKLSLKESNLPMIVDYDEINVFNFLKDFYDNLCHILATDGSIRKDALYDFLDDLLKKYPYTI